MTSESGLSRRAVSGELQAYFLLAYAISWSLWLPLIATVQGWWDVEMPRWWHYTGSAGPVVAAVLVSARTQGRRGVVDLLRQYSSRRAALPWIAFAVLSPLSLLGLAMIVARLLDGAWPSYAELSHADNLPALALPITLAVHTLTFGVGEETGWRGFALPRFQRELVPLQATHRLAVLWGLWHLPTFFENESMMQMGPLEVLGWSAGLWMGAIFLTWLYNGSRGSLLVVVIWHGLFNQFSASEASSIVPAVMSAGVIACTVWLLASDQLNRGSPVILSNLSRSAR